MFLETVCFYANCFVSQDEIYLNLVLEFIPETVYKVARQYSKQKQVLIIINKNTVLVFTYRHKIGEFPLVFSN